MRKINLILAIVFIMTMMCSCGYDESGTVDSKTNKLQEDSLEQMCIAIDGLPKIKNWTEAKTLKEIIEDRDNPKLICYWYIYNEMTGLLMYQGKCKGYGIPYSTQFTNPEKVVNCETELGEDLYNGEPAETLPRAEPNGLFSATSSSATWVNALSEDGKSSAVEYVEPLIVVSKTKKPARLCDPDTLPSEYNNKDY